ncbi:MAG: D-alanyl-D-alanine carboxypeptidase/D-alanyl-D-alanine-endopeptidase [Candidatus Acidiferrales bacterium]
MNFPTSPFSRRAKSCSCAITISIATLLVMARPLAAQKPCCRSKPSQQSNASTAARPDLERFRSRVDTLLSEAHARKADWGILIANRDTGETLFDLNADRYFTPASNAKLFTSVFALATLGTGYRFHTTLESTSTLGSDGKLLGDLLLVGRGDPDLSNRKFPFLGKVEHDGPTEKILAELADAALARGLKEVDGDIVADDRYIPFDPYPAGWSIGDLFFTFGTPVTAITFNDNSVTITMSPGARSGDPALIVVDPPEAAAGFTQQITTSPPGTDPRLAVVRQPGPNFLLLHGSVPLGHAPVKLDLALTDPAETAARTLKHLLEARGVNIKGGVRVEEASAPQALKPGEAPVLLSPELRSAEENSAANVRVLAEHVSPPLLESVRVTNKVSQNLHAELFLRTIAREKTGIGSTEIGLKLEEDFLKSLGVAEGDAALTDGSGLSTNNLVTPRAVVALLQYAIHQPWGPDFMATLPIAGVDGTLEDRMKGTPASGLIQAKTGGLEHVHALSGYATTVGGEYLVFSIFVNNDPEKGRDAIAAIDAIALAMVEAIGAPTNQK